jgi:Holliday junction resolvasome RuvABC endonuclease subunit
MQIDFMNVFIGIDPSINSTGMTIRTDTGFCRFFIIKGDKLTKKEKNAQLDNSEIFEYCLYQKENVKDTNNAHERELAKAHNLSTIADTIYNIIEELLQQFRKTSSIDSVTICMEGISYGSIHSAAVMDLAGLNYLIRDRLHHHTVVGTLLVTPPAEVKRFYTGSGNANKQLMISTFKGSFPDFDLPKIDDICDSEAMAKYARDWFEKNQ